MRNRFNHLAPVFGYVGTLLMVFSGIILLPILVMIFTAGGAIAEASVAAYIIPALLSLAVGAVCHFSFRKGPLTSSQSMLVCVLGWLAISAVGAMPFWMTTLSEQVALARSPGIIGDASRISYLDAYFEAMSGFTTTGITMFAGLDFFPRSLLFWRSLTQWLGGLGILSFFILLIFSARSSHTLYGAESHKIFSKRPRPGMFNTVKVLWLIYCSFTLAILVGLGFSGVSLFDALNLSLTTISTGGYAPYDESIGYFAARPGLFPHYRAIEYVIIGGMLAGGTNFFVHYRLATGRLRSLWDTAEVRLWWAIIITATALVALEVSYHGPVTSSVAAFEERVRASLFQVIALLTSTGFGTKDISAPGYFFAVSRQIFLLLMIVGGCVGSTGGGVKVFRVQLLGKALAAEISRAVRPRRAVRLLRVDGDVVESDELSRVAALFFAWLALIAAGGLITAALSNHGAFESISGMTSAVSNIGPCYISAGDLIRLHPLIKLTYILGMLAGRLEILPVLLLFNRRAWT